MLFRSKSEIEKTQFIKKIALKIKVNEENVWNDLKKIEAPSINSTENFEPKTQRKEGLEKIIEERSQKIVELERTLSEMKRQQERDIISADRLTPSGKYPKAKY